MAIKKRETAIIVINLSLIALFAGLGYEINSNHVHRIDERIMVLVHSRSRPRLDAAMRLLTHLGDAKTLIIAALALAWFFFKLYARRRDAFTILLALASSITLNNIFKIAFQRERPAYWELIARPHTYSFPSGHAMTSMAVYGCAAYLLETAFPRYRWCFRLLAAALILLIGASRVYLGVHWPSDVLAGFAAGLVLVFAAAYWNGSR